ncbi:MAG: TonB-dependent receptor [Opitutae bacterium]|nr:TonB-dependent receptor [Opitutae bacterium]
MTSPCRPYPRTILRAFAVCCSLWLAGLANLTAAPADDAARKKFDLPPAYAAQTLRQFAEQSGLEIIFSSENTAQVKTNAVKGTYSPKEAIELLLTGTGLVAEQNARTGAFTILRKPKERATEAPAAPPTTANGFGVITGRVSNVVTGQYLNNARVTVRGTNLAVFSDQEGFFRINQAPAGLAVLEVMYTGLDVKTVTVAVVAGQDIARDIQLTNVNRYGSVEESVVLDTFVVSAAKETEGMSLAANEQRFAANIKNVVSTDAYGDITAGNVAEFMRFLPGITVDYEDASPIEVSVRGLGAAFTQVSIDGEQTANAVSTGGSRTFQFKQVSINNTSRIEVTKVPTPADPASSLAGSVNMVSKSAFERKGAQFNYKVYLAGNGDELAVRKTAYVDETKTYKIQPAFDFDYTLPISKNFGIVIAGLMSKQFNNQNHSSYSFGQSGSGTGQALTASPDKPIVSAYSFIDAPKYITRDSLSLKADWRVAPHSVLSVSVQGNYFRDDNGNFQMTFSTGTNGSPSITGGVPLTYGDSFTSGATGRGSVTQSGMNHHISGMTTAQNIRYRFDNGDWRVEATAASSQSRSWRRYISEGNFNQLAVSLKDPVRVVFENVGPTRPGNIRLYNNTNQEISLYDIHSFKVTGADEASWGNIRDNFDSGSLNVRKNLELWGIPSAVQVGGREQLQKRRVRLNAFNYTYTNPDQDAGPFLTKAFAGRKTYWGWENIPWASPYIAYQAWQQNPGLFTVTPAQVVAAEVSRITNTLDFNERVTALYAQIEMRPFKGRLRLLTGVRWEKTDDEGAGPSNEPSNVYVRNASGAFVYDSNGARIRRPDAGAAGSLEELRLTRKALGTHSQRSYHGYYPSVHLSYNVTEDFIARLAFAETFGRPDLGSIIPFITITENASSATSPGSLNVRNTGLKPWSAENYDLSLEYYTKEGGVFTAGCFRKDIKDFFGSVVKDATLEDLNTLDLDDKYVGWALTTTNNVGKARVTGVEISARQTLGFAGAWGRSFSVFANATKLRLQGDRTADFAAFQPTSYNWGFTFSKKPVVFTAKWNYRGQQRLTALASYGSDAYQYWKARTTLDLNVDYQMTKRLALFAIARNVTNEKYVRLGYGARTPEYARQLSVREYGVQLSAGLKGSF